MTQDYSGQNLRGRSFKGENLAGANFSHSDIRGASFRNANLTGANLSHSQAGLQRRWAILLVALALFLAALSGAASGLAGIMTSGIVSPPFTREYSVIPAGILSVSLAIYYTVTVRQGYTSGLVACAVSISAAVAIIGTLTGALAGSGVAALTVAWVVVGTLTGAIAFVVVGAVARSETLSAALAFVSTFYWVFAGSVAWYIAGIVAKAGIGAPPGKATVAKSVAVAYSKVGAYSIAWAFAGSGAEIIARTVAVAGACGVAALGVYVGVRSLAADDKFALPRRIGIFLAATGGTNFREANLTDADFSAATLKNTNFNGATLTRTSFSHAKKLDRSRIWDTYLKDAPVRLLVITGNGRDKNFDRLNLQGLNLRGANLDYASFIGANLSEANLQSANLSNAKLVQTQLDNADLTGATLTGAYIEDWGLTIGTKLDGVTCEYIYMRLPTKDDPDACRKPDNKNEVFREGDFADFIAPIFKTLDLYHNQGVDPRSIAIAFKRLAENHPEADLELVAMEKRGLDKFLLRAKTAEGVDRSQLSAEYFEDYNRLKSLPKNDIGLLLAEQDARIRSLETMLATALNPNSFAGTASRQSKDADSKLAILTLGDGDFERGFPGVSALIWTDERLPVRFPGKLPPDPEIPELYRRWKSMYDALGFSFRVSAEPNQAANVSKPQFRQLSEQLGERLNTWLNSDTFRPIQNKLREKFQPADELRVIIQAEGILRQLPWHLWDFFDTYRKAEVALSAPIGDRAEKSAPPRTRIRILAILGNSSGIDIEADRALLQNLPDAETVFLPEPQRRQVNEQLWDEQGWDILFFAGHSFSHADGQTGHICINRNEPNSQLSVPDLKNALKKAIERGLKLAIFNSCDGLGLARQLAEEHIPQIIVMRQDVPDLVAQEFLKNFLTAFAGNKSLYASVREARERLQGLEDEYPCATWLPVICQNPAEIPPTWQQLLAPP